MKCCVKQCVPTILERFRTFNIAEIAVFKICLLTFGVLIGINGRPILKPFHRALRATFVGSCLYLIFRLVVSPELEEETSLVHRFH